MTLEVQSKKFDEKKEKVNIKFSEEQLEILKDEYNKKCANEEMSQQQDYDTIEYCRKKYRVSKRDALDMINR